MPSLKREQARCMLAAKNASRGIQAGMDVEFNLDGNRTQKRHRGDSNPCGQSPMDFESISLATRTQCLAFDGATGRGWLGKRKKLGGAIPRANKGKGRKQEWQKPPLGIEPRTFSLQD